MKEKQTEFKTENKNGLGFSLKTYQKRFLTTAERLWVLHRTV